MDYALGLPISSCAALDKPGDPLGRLLRAELDHLCARWDASTVHLDLAHDDPAQVGDAPAM